MGFNDRMTDAELRKFVRKAKARKSPKPVLLPNQPGQYGEFALEYWKKGLKAFPAQDKKPCVKGATGHDGVIALENVTEWSQHYSLRFAHVSLRPEGWLGIDVDDYDGKQGASQLEALEAELGRLPATYTSTSRGPYSKSRQYFYRIPDDVPRKSKAADDIEIVQRCHRNAAVYPSYHRKTGEIYRWYQPDGKRANRLPRLDEFARLPEPWLNYLARNSQDLAGFETHELFSGDLTPWVKWLGDGEPSDAYRQLGESIADEPHIGHDLLGYYLREIHDYRLKYEETGGVHALALLYNRYLETTNHPDPEKEWDDWVRWVIKADWAPTSAPARNLRSAVMNWAKKLTGGAE